MYPEVPMQLTCSPQPERPAFRVGERAGSTDLRPADGEEGCQPQCRTVPQSSRCQLSDGPTRGIVADSRAAHGCLKETLSTPWTS